MKPYLALSAFLLLHPVAVAAEGEPIAVRFWEDYTVSIESHSGLSLGIKPDSMSKAVASSHRVDEVVGFKNEWKHILFRKPNTAEPVFGPVRRDQSGSNGILVSSEHPEVALQGHGLRVEVDGLSIVVLTDLGEPSRTCKWDVESADVLVIPALTGQGVAALDHPALRTYVKALSPKRVVVPAEMNEDRLIAFAKAIGGSGSKPLTLSHNTFAVSKPGLDGEGEVRIVKLANTPAKLPDELEKLFVAMEESNARSQKVFAKLSAKQLNFRPSNGTHTPRWNSEHMMGRQLLFFSQIYHALDPAIPVMNLNPKQMPPDYKAAHPDWDGAEEARQMQRVSEFTRRFAYLLEGVDLDKRAPGSGWTLRALLRQMDRHYDGHTANTVKKFSLPDWPSE